MWAPRHHWRALWGGRGGVTWAGAAAEPPTPTHSLELLQVQRKAESGLATPALRGSTLECRAVGVAPQAGSQRRGGGSRLEAHPPTHPSSKAAMLHGCATLLLGKVSCPGQGQGFVEGHRTLPPLDYVGHRGEAPQRKGAGLAPCIPRSEERRLSEGRGTLQLRRGCRKKEHKAASQASTCWGWLEHRADCAALVLRTAPSRCSAHSLSPRQPEDVRCRSRDQRWAWLCQNSGQGKQLLSSHAVTGREKNRKKGLRPAEKWKAARFQGQEP